jgi:hypothetical protein
VDFTDLPASDDLHHQIADAVRFQEISLVSSTDKLKETAKTVGKERFGRALMGGSTLYLTV